MNLKVIFIIAIIAIIIGGVLLWQNNKNTTEQGVIKIGVLESITGQGATWGNQAKEGALLAEQELLSEGKDIKVLVEDSKNDPKEALSAFNKLSGVENIDALVTMGSGVLVALVPEVTAKQILTINGGAVSAKLSGISQYEFNIVPLAPQDVSYIIGQAMDKFGNKKIALLVSNDEAGISSGDVAKQIVEVKNGEVVAYEKYANTDTDFKTQILKIKQAQPQAIFLGGGALGLVIKQIKEQDLQAQLFSYAPFENPDFIKQGGSATEGVIYTGLEIDQSSAAMKKFQVDYKNKFGHEPSLYSYTTYDAVKILAKYFADCHKDKNCVLEKMKNQKFAGIYNSNIIFNDKGELQNPSFYLKTVKDGQFVKY